MILPAEGETHLWWAFPDRIHDPELLERQFATLSAEERERQRRFVSERDRKRYLVSHALVRHALSQYASVPPREWQFELNPYGRPSIREPAAWRSLQFNLSHTEGRAVVAVAWEMDIGVDVESTAPERDLAEIAERYFSPIEIAQLRKKPEAFFDFWTLKEAYIKARGMGLSIPLDSFSFLLEDAEEPRILFHEGCPDRPDRWRFALRRGDGYRVAVAAAVGTKPLRIIERETVPLEESPAARDT
ncbi:MAG TPA: 4'-phosphopantetheinyl transferase superfamily protein [Bryobacteraceae bacterium]|nr:4'-phosphopantetheinyl transferase superfamily protein [Bryobacteraceae bacterium]HOQ46687.1 4'-phosphopantetheinyl transferase superfamily protein [Bryobacteraceae bacterium]HPQ16863.1 4'-phosphopantetheinyl transferase superfamily protein [Bryobacteraceae bacterium]HPU72357.1 4'-phosphopantetheinyl transferase superfamily protein [Bryobacteraceae bacterium]